MDSSTAQAAALDSFLSRHPAAGTTPVQIFRAAAGSYLEGLRGRALSCLQTAKPEADALARLGFDPLAESAAPAGLAVVFATKHKEEVLYHIARAAELLEAGGELIVSAANDLGAASLERRCAEAFGPVETYSKHKCRVFRARNDPARRDAALLDAWRRGGELRRLAESGLYSQPGLFSWKQVDPGSRLLAGQLPAELRGRGADLGAGNGYLSRELLSRAAGVTELHLFEAEKKALDAAARNLEAGAGTAELHWHWADVTQGLGVDRLDFVVMNPPFHAGRNTVPALGRAFVQVALAALKPGGRLFLVANRHLPYAAEITAPGGVVTQQIESGGFRVLIAERPR